MSNLPDPGSLNRFVEKATRFLFFTGKGGVGKTSLACASALALADRGLRVLLVSTDPASNLDEVLGQKLNGSPTPIPGAEGLRALNIDPEATAQAYRDRMVGPYRGKLPDAMVRSMEEQLSGACTMEIAAFDEFARLLGDPAATAGFDHVIFDTAPTGHTLRLMTLPSAWTGFLDTNTSGTSCLGPLAGLQKQRAIYEGSVAALADSARTTLVLVSRPQKAALDEAERTSNELSALGVRNQHLILNGVFHACCPEDKTATALERRGTNARQVKGDFLKRLPPVEVPLHAHNLVGIPALRRLTGRGEVEPIASGKSGQDLPPLESLSELVDDLVREGRGVIMTMGKGGVGKTTVAAAIATDLARRGLPVHLSTTDPAAHVAAAAGETAGFQVSRIDPQEETRAYVQQVMATAGPGLDANGRALLEEDLRSPCTEEIAVFRAFARIVAQGRDRFVVLDTAPTGHTLLLLDATEAYHREIARKASGLPEEVLRLLPRLRDSRFTRVLIVTLPEATPVHEAAALQAGLRRAHIEPFAWVINQSFARADTRDPLLLARGAGEQPFIQEVTRDLARRTAIVPWVPEEPVGPAKLQQLFQPKTKSRRNEMKTEMATGNMASASPVPVPKRLNFFERYLSLWVLVCMAVGVALGRLLPDFIAALSKLEFGEGSQVNVPIAVLIWLMIYPMMLKIDFGSLVGVSKRPKGLLVTLFVNWLVKPFSMAFFAWVFIHHAFSAWIDPETAKNYTAGLIILAAAPCTAMVFVWSYLTDGDPAYTLVQVAVNDLIMLLLFAPIVMFLCGVANVVVPSKVLITSVVVFIVIPLAAGFLTRKGLLKSHGQEWFEKSFLPKFHPVTIVALLATLVLIFAFQAENLTTKWFAVILLAIPIMVQVYFNSSLTYGLMRLFRVPHNVASPGALIGASNFFELAVAVAITLFGTSSGAALACVVGVLVEVPVMLSVCKVCNASRGWYQRRVVTV